MIPIRRIERPHDGARCSICDGEQDLIIVAAATNLVLLRDLLRAGRTKRL
jgi:hypothetical protein